MDAEFTVRELDQSADGESLCQVVDKHGVPYGGLRFTRRRHAQLTAAMLNHAVMMLERGYMYQSNTILLGLSEEMSLPESLSQIDEVE